MPEQIKKQLAKNTIWNALERFSLLGVQLICTFILARFLKPDDFGIIGMLIVFTTISNTIIDSGFVQTLIREKDVSEREYSSVFYFNVFVAIIIYIILYFCSPYIADFYHQPILNGVCKLTFLVIPANALCLVQNAILMRNIQFKKICIATIIASVTSSVIAIFLAYYFRNVWALVVQNVVTYVLKAIMLWIMTGWIPKLYFSISVIKKYFSFSKNLLISGLIGNIFNNIYSIVIGRYYTATDLGFYMQADRIKNVASMSTTSVIQNVTYPILSKVNNNGGNIKDAYRKIITTTVVFVGFIMALLMCVSCDLFEVLMGNYIWRVSGTYLFILSISGLLFPLHAINQNILLVKGDSKSILRLEIIRRITMIVILLITLHYDIIIFISGTAIYSFLLLFLNLHFCGKPINYSVFQQLKDVSPIFFRIGIMITITLLISRLYSNMDLMYRTFLTLLLAIIIGLIVFWRNASFKETIVLLQSLFRFKKNAA